jgi:hypothetical protein
MIVRMRMNKWESLQFGVYQLSSPDQSIGFLEVFATVAEFFKAYPEETDYFEIGVKNEVTIPEPTSSPRSRKKRDGVEGKVLPVSKRSTGGKSRGAKAKSKQPKTKGFR